MTIDLPSPDDVLQAARRIAGRVHRTPVMTSRTLDQMAGRSLFFKCENLQRCGAFKARGAMNAVLQLTAEQAARGVVTDSSGNHGQALAWAATQRGIPCHVVMPSDAPTVKQAAVRGYGAEIVLCAPTQADRLRTSQRLRAETGATYISSHNDPAVIAGQGTAALELFADVPHLDAIVAPIGGGGLISGIGLAMRARSPKAQIWGAEPHGADAAARSMATGARVTLDRPESVASGLLVGVNTRTWPLIRDHIAGVLTVSDAEIIAAMRICWERLKLVVEPSGATALAAILQQPGWMPHARRIGIVLSGGNVDLRALPF